MSYILDALRKSESERRQGKVPDLGQQVQMVHTPRPARRLGVGAWIAFALTANAAVMAYVFWPGTTTVPAAGVDEAVTEQPVQPAPSLSAAAATTPPAAKTTVAAGAVSSPDAGMEAAAADQPTIIVPSPRSSHRPPASEAVVSGRVPHLVELPLSFQKSIPDLTFSSHIFASDPQARRVMINGHYLRPGESFSGLVVEQITEEGVILSKQGQRFRIGVVRDWVSPR